MPPNQPSREPRGQGHPVTDLRRTLIEAVEDGRIEGETCDYAGHEWADAGGGLSICLVCEAEKFDA